MEKSVILNLVWKECKDDWIGVSGVDFSPDGKYLAIACYYKHTVELMSTRDGSRIWRRTLRSSLYADPCVVAYSPDGRYLAIASEDRKDALQLLRAEDGNTVWSIGDYEGALDVAFSPDGRHLAVAHFYDRTVRLLSPLNGSEVWEAKDLDGAR